MVTQTMLLAGRAGVNELRDEADGNSVSWEVLVEKTVGTTGAMMTKLGVVYCSESFVGGKSAE